MSSLRAELEQQKEELARQMRELREAQRKIEELEARILAVEAFGTIEGSASKESPRAESATGDLAASPVPSVVPAQRDRVGDLNAEMIRAGEFPGSLELPGTEKISLAIGGFFKAVAIADSDAEAAGAAFLPAFLQTGREDVRGSFSIDSTLSRLFFDARSPVTFGNLRGYLEFDLNDGN